ncbi:hypothetical protein BHE74_00023022 [Ensete ventricosum]|nr:hypothetical protein BHE74_00023022 [Ensete ventricosum]
MHADASCPTALLGSGLHHVLLRFSDVGTDRRPSTNIVWATSCLVVLLGYRKRLMTCPEYTGHTRSCNRNAPRYSNRLSGETGAPTTGGAQPSSVGGPNHVATSPRVHTSALSPPI